MNVGSTRYRLGDLEAAAQSFEAAGAAGDDRLRAHAWYDLGNVAFERGRLEDAIEHYHRTLDLDPTDADAKFNLEVASAELERRRQDAANAPRQQDDPSEPKEGEENEENGDDPQQSAGGDEDEGNDDDRGGAAPEESTEGRESEPREAPSSDPGEASQREGGEQAGSPSTGRDAAEGRLSEAEANRLLEALEEGRPRRRPPPGRRRDQEKDW